MKRIRCLFLDMGGVLTQDHRLAKVDEMMGLIGLGLRDGGPAVAREAFLEVYYAERIEYDRGAIDGAEYWRRVAGAFGASVADGSASGADFGAASGAGAGPASGPAAADIARLVRTDLASWFNMRPAMMEFLGGARGRVGKVVLLSNIHFDGARYLREGEGRSWAGSFDELVLSCEHRLLKPEREIYELALDMAGALPSESLFVDDNAANVAGARAAGMSSFRFEGEDSFAETLAREYELAR